MTHSWTLAVARDDLTRTELVETPAPDLTDGEVLLRVDRVGMTANNVTYALLGESWRYWQFFPTTGRGIGPEWGITPLWGFAVVAASTVMEVPVGQRLYGYLPSASHLVVRPDRIDTSGFRDVSGHRTDLPSAYNSYRLTTGDPAYRADQEDLMILFRPLFYTSFVLADQLVDNGCYGAAVVVMSSASSKTAYGAAFELQGKGPRVTGLTSPANVDFTRSLGCYDDVVAYDDISTLLAVPTVYVDLSGAPAIRNNLRQHLGDQLVREVAVGFTSQSPDADTTGDVFFAPTQIRKRAIDWGRNGLDLRFSEAWHRFAATATAWVDVTVGEGPRALEAAWLDVLAGRTPPRVGHVIQL
jgi:hypothetical protein